MNSYDKHFEILEEKANQRKLIEEIMRKDQEDGLYEGEKNREIREGYHEPTN